MFVGWTTPQSLQPFSLYGSVCPQSVQLLVGQNKKPSLLPVGVRQKANEIKYKALNMKTEMQAGLIMADDIAKSVFIHCR